jgi:hypothetical protein
MTRRASSPSRFARQQSSPQPPDRARLVSAADRAFRLVNRPENSWARDFLFNDSRSAAAHMLTNAAALPYAVTTKLSSSAFEDVSLTGTGAGGIFDYAVDIDFLYVPSFSSGLLTAGVIVNRVEKQFSTSSAEQSACHPHLSQKQSQHHTFHGVGRFILDTGTGENLALLHADFGITIVLWVYNESPSKRKCLRFMCDQGMLKRGCIVDAIVRSFTDSESRFCPFCKASPAESCGCVYPSFMPEHSFDFSGFNLAMRCQFGEFIGSQDALAVVPTRNCTSPVYIRSPLLSRVNTNVYWPGCEMQGETSIHDSISSLLTNFATQLYISGANPSRLVMPCSPAGPVSFSERRLSDVCHSADDIVEEEALLCDFLVEPERPTEMRKTDSIVLDSICSGGDMTPVTGGESVDEVGCMFAAEEDGLLSIECAAFAQFDAHTGMRNHDLETVTVLAGDPCARTLPASQPLDVQYTNVNDLWSVGEARSSADAGCSFGPDIAIPDDTRTADEDEREARAARRRERNRVAAARSNARRKARNDSLKSDIKSSHDRVLELQERQFQLRRENENLRLRLDQHS